MAEGLKGNPASHRMSNKTLKEHRASSWARGKKRKEQRIAAQEARAKANRAARAAGFLTPWEEAQKARRARRATGRA